MHTVVLAATSETSSFRKKDFFSTLKRGDYSRTKEIPLMSGEGSFGKKPRTREKERFIALKKKGRRS